MKTITIGCWENDPGPQCIEYPLISKEVLLLYDLSAFPGEMQSAVFYENGQCVLTPRTTRALFTDLEIHLGISYAQSKAITQLLTQTASKVPYAVNQLLYFEIKEKASTYSHWCAFHHLTKTDKEDQHVSLILSDCLRVILPYCTKTVHKQLQQYRLIQHTHETLAYAIIDNLQQALHSTRPHSEVIRVPHPINSEFMPVHMTLNDTLYLIQNTVCDRIEKQKDVYIEPKDLAIIRKRWG